MFYNFKNVCFNVNNIIRVTKLFTNEIEIVYYTASTIYHERVYYNTEKERDITYSRFVNSMRK